MQEARAESRAGFFSWRVRIGCGAKAGLKRVVCWCDALRRPDAIGLRAEEGEALPRPYKLHRRLMAAANAFVEMRKKP